jgi:solute carrier family 31 (copper transporter), member 1
MMPMTFAAGLGPTLWFDGWAPSGAGSTFAACLGLFLLAALSRLLHAAFGALHVCRQDRSSRAISLQSENEKDDQDIPTVESASPFRGTSPSRRRRRVPFALSVDLGRGVLAFFTWGIGYFLMLAVVRLSVCLSRAAVPGSDARLFLLQMTYNAYYFVAILLGTAVGETLFGRMTHPAIEFH